MSSVLSARFRRQGTQLFDQQMWLWGQDVKHQESNGLIRFGFERHPSPDPAKYGSAYILNHGSTMVALWAFGLYVGCRGQGSLFLRRFQFAPQLADATSLEKVVWEPSEIGGFGPPSRDDRGTLLGLMNVSINWIIEYETWAKTTFSPTYREQCVALWHKRQTPAEEIIPAWRQLARDVHQELTPKT